MIAETTGASAASLASAGTLLVPAFLLISVVALLAWMAEVLRAALYRQAVRDRVKRYVGTAPIAHDREDAREPGLTRWLIAVDPGTRRRFAAVGGLAVGLAALAVLRNAPLAALFGFATGVGPDLYVQHALDRRREAIMTQLPDALALVNNILSSGGTLVQALRSSLPFLSSPLQPELELLAVEYEAGQTIDEALRRFQQRTGIEEIALLAASIGMQQRLGGNLNQLLQSTADVMRERTRLRRNVRVLTAEVRSSAVVLAAMVPGSVLFLAVVQPSMVAPLSGTLAGQVMGLVSAGLWLAGILVIRTMMRRIQV
jgi:tight adherence protein B